MPSSRRHPNNIEIVDGKVFVRPDAPWHDAKDDLRRYLGMAILPRIHHKYGVIPQGRDCVRRRKLKVRHDPDRRIERIRRHDPKTFDEAVLAYHRDYIYSREGPPFAGKHYQRPENEKLVLCVPTAKRIFQEGGQDWRREERLDDFELSYPSNIGDTCTWLLKRPLQTMQGAIHLAFPDTARWWLDEAEAPSPDRDRETWRTYLWRFHPDEHQPVWWRDVPGSESGIDMEPAPHESMIIAVQPHWLAHMGGFVTCTNLPRFSEDGTPPAAPLTNPERMWAKLQDTCKRHKCPTFALTTYDGWVFGTFSKDWTSAEISEYKGTDATKPTVIQALVYWVSSSMGLAGTTEFPPQTVPANEGGSEVEAH